jgi:2-(1,2-epoxy-1,2-dihydrophenyl)acetyl-CoA isomerase
MGYEHLICEKDRSAHIATVTLNRPEKLNAIDRQMHQEIMALGNDLQQDDDIWVIIWTGKGRGFCSGADVIDGARFKLEKDTPLNDRLTEDHWNSTQGKMLYEIDKPMIAAVNGVAAGAGYSLALSCDIRVGSEEARFTTIYSRRNLPPEGGMSYMLPRIVGMGRAMDLMLTSRMVGAEEAYRLGLLDRLVKPDDLLSTAREIAKQMTEIPPAASRITKRTIRRAMDDDFNSSSSYEVYSGKLTAMTPKDGEEARLSFDEKRKPKFIGR